MNSSVVIVVVVVVDGVVIVVVVVFVFVVVVLHNLTVTHTQALLTHISFYLFIFTTNQLSFESNF